jgi:hypothetical protein
MNLIKPGLRHQDLEGIHLPSFRFSWKLKKLSWQTAEYVMVLPRSATIQKQKNRFTLTAALSRAAEFKHRNISAMSVHFC